MKKLFVILMTVSFLTALSACGGGSGKATKEGDTKECCDEKKAGKDSTCCQKQDSTCCKHKQDSACSKPCEKGTAE